MTELSQHEVRAVHPEHLDIVWPRVLPLIERALARGQGDESTPEDVLSRLATGESQLWVVARESEITAAAVLSVMDSAKKRKLHIDILSGTDMPAWVDQLEDLFRKFKDRVDADCIEASCRPGLARVLSNRGWRRKAVVMSIE